MSLADAPLSRAAPPRDRVQGARRLTFVLVALLIVVSLTSLSSGATGTALWPALKALATGQELSALDRVVLLDIRLPRLILGLLVGAALAVSGGGIRAVAF